jgi:hypothetical protein
MKFVQFTGLLLMISIFSFSQNILKIQPNTTVDLNGGVILTLNDMSLDNEGTLNPAVGSGRIVFRGADNNFIRGAGVTNFDELQIFKSGSGTLMLQVDFNIRSGVWFNGGLIDVDNRVLTLLGNASLNGESETSRIIASGNGYVQASMQLNAPEKMNPGNLGAIITSKNDLGFTNIRRGHLQQAIEAGRISVKRYFDIIPENNTNLGATLRMEYADAELEKQSEDALGFRLYNGRQWIKAAASSRNTTANFVELQNLNNLGRITLADDGAGLPVEFMSFTVECRSNAVLVSWATASEQNSGYFDVQSSANGSSWTTIATVPAAGNSNSEKRYAYTDQNPQGKFYRVKEVDLDGSFQYSITGVADCGTGYAFRMWPNPVQDRLFITIKADSRTSAVINVYNSKGQLVKKQNNGLLPGNNQLVVDMANLISGLYHVEVISNDGTRRTMTVSKK